MIVYAMRRFLFTIKAFIVAAAITCCIVFAYALVHAPVFERGERYEFYTGTSSEEVILASSPFEKLFLKDIKGESVRYSGDRAEELIHRFHAKILFTEEAAGVTNYYCYTSLLKGGVWLNGYRVNLHIAVGKEQTAAGTPVIFGGF